MIAGANQDMIDPERANFLCQAGRASVRVREGASQHDTSKAVEPSMRCPWKARTT